MIKLVEDVVAPVGVAAVDLIVDATQPTYTKWADYAMTVAGYGAALMNKGGDLMKNVGIASLPLSIKCLYAQVKSMASGTTRTAGRVGHYAGMGARAGRLSAKPEFQDNVLY